MSTYATHQQERIAAAAGGAPALDVVLPVAAVAGARRPWTATNPTFAVMAPKHGSTPAPRPEEAVP
jgi:hypothetical protein